MATPFNPDAYISDFNPDAYLADSSSASSATTKPDSSMSDVARQAAGEAVFAPNTLTREAAMNPVTQAKMLPPLAGAAGAIVGGPFSMTKAQIPARALSDLALATYGRSDQIPSPMAHGLEAIGTLAADVMAVPYVHKAVAGKAIGEAEQAAGVITRAPDKLPSAGNVGEYLNTLESQIDNGTVNTAQAARDAVAGMRYINSNPNIVGKSSDIAVQAARVGQKAQELLNKLVPNRLAPATAMANAMKVPNVISKTAGKVFPVLRKNTLPIAGAAALEEYVRRTMFH